MSVKIAAKKHGRNLNKYFFNWTHHSRRERNIFYEKLHQKNHFYYRTSQKLNTISSPLYINTSYIDSPSKTSYLNCDRAKPPTVFAPLTVAFCFPGAGSYRLNLHTSNVSIRVVLVVHVSHNVYRYASPLAQIRTNDRASVNIVRAVYRRTGE